MLLFSLRVESDVLFVSPFPAVCTSPFSTSLNKDALFKLKGDIFAGQVKKEVEDISIKVF